MIRDLAEGFHSRPIQSAKTKRELGDVTPTQR
jgi:hypothetical protein